MAISKIITSSLTDDAVTSAKIGTDQVGADALSSSAISGAVDIPANSVGESELSVDYTAQSVPHIIPGVLQPAVAGKLLNGADHSGAYGTPQTQSGGDGHSYYYTDIKGSKPIKDPRIGGHFGSQRHRISSVQLLEQETATHGSNVYSVDGRNWMRCCATDKEFATYNGGNGNAVECYGSNSSSFFEITGYFNSVNLGGWTHSSRGAEFSVNGGSVSTSNFFTTTVMNPLRDRYVPSANYVNLTNSLTLGINTIKIIPEGSDTGYFFGVELIAQDTTSTANRSKIQIPSQDVVSYGKKFNVSAEGSSGHHYNPFNGYTATTSFSSVVDVDTSLGLEAWKHTDNNYYPPVNGGRVVKWVDSSGVIKTSVTLMPPNATGIGSFSSNPRDPNYGSWSSQYQPTFKNETERQLHEVAKTFHWREFGNGSANGGTGSSYLDASMLDTNERNIAYVMDDGLTTVAGDQVYKSGAYGLLRWDTGSKIYFTFIGTGLTWNTSTLGIKHWAQNLPYGTHIVELETSSTSSEGTFKIDGVTVKSDFANSGDLHIYKWHPSDDITFHQPKRPPIPEDAVVLCDYMLMADFVADTVGDTEKISKGTRIVSPSRDFFYDEDANTSFNNIIIDPNSAFGLTLPDTGTMTSGSISAQLPYFGKEVIWRTLASRFGTFTEYVNNTSVTTTSISTNSNYNAKQKITGQSLGLNGIKTVKSSDRFLFAGLEVATPIHTSSHYQSFETPFLHELVGGDRNMEQTNLVVSPDGKTWDEVTRDVSYIGKTRLHTVSDGAVNNTSVNVFDEWRGTDGTYPSASFYNKDFAIAFDRVICLVDGCYHVTMLGFGTGTNDRVQVYINGTAGIIAKIATANESSFITWTGNLKRGDYLQSYSDMEQDSPPWAFFHIDRI